MNHMAKHKVKIECNLDNLMKARPDMSVRLLSKLSGVSRWTIYQLKDNSVSTGFENLSRLADALGVTHNEILRTVKDG